MFDDTLYDMMTWIYVLKCKQNKYYVGKTNKTVVQRYTEHLDGDGAEWTRIYRPCEILEVIQGDNFDEDKYTKKYMSKYGIHNVRGGTYSAVHLDQKLIKHLQNELAGCNDKCFSCNQKGHFAKECPYEDDSESEEDTEEDSDDDDNWVTKRVIEKLLAQKRCLGCGRKGHFVRDCFAKTYDNSLNQNEVEVLSSLCEESLDQLLNF